MDFWEWLRNAIRRNPDELGSAASPAVTLPTVVVRGRRQPGSLEEQLIALQNSRLARDTIPALLGYSPTIERDNSQYKDYSTAKAQGNSAIFNNQWLQENGEIPDHYNSIRDIGVHEFGHLFADKNPAIYETLKPFYSQNREQNWNAYSASAPQEHAATVFMEAMNRLQATRENPALAKVMYDRADETTPGTQQMMSILLSQPIFARHPLNRP
jgi:hypothetical protein